MGKEGDGMGHRGRTGDGTRREGRGRVPRVGDDPVIFTMGMLTIGLVLGAFVGLLVTEMAAPPGPDPGTEALRGDVETLSDQVHVMTAIVEELEERSADPALGAEGARARLEAVSEDLLAIGSTLQEVREELDRRQGPIDGASEDLGDIRVELLDVRMELVNLQQELDDLIAQVIAGGGSGGNGTPTVPENATQLPSPHLSHYRTPLLDPTCGMCHDAEPPGEVIVSGSRMYWNGSLDEPGFNTVVDRDAECVECHGLFAETGMEPGYIDVSCVACHDDWADRMNAPYVVEVAVADDDCLLCHGGPNAFIDIPQGY